jgi:hypothetical protein
MPGYQASKWAARLDDSAQRDFSLDRVGLTRVDRRARRVLFFVGPPDPINTTFFCLNFLNSEEKIFDFRWLKLAFKTHLID